jgi:hypothetical protein
LASSMKVVRWSISRMLPLSRVEPEKKDGAKQGIV